MPRSSVNAWAGNYDQRITVWRNSPTTNDDGQRVESLSKIATRWASVTQKKGSEGFGNQQTLAAVTHEVRMRRDGTTSGLTPADVLKLSDGTRLDIVYIYDVDLRRIEMVAECMERV